jgi:short-subunit dehydrogenase
MIAITGGSGDLAVSLAKELILRDQEFYLYTRSSSSVFSKDLSSKVINVLDYSNLKFETNTSILIITNGKFVFRKFLDFSEKDLIEILEANFLSVVRIIRSYLACTDPKLRRRITIIGSTAAYDFGAQTSLYSCLKFSLLGLVRALNNEYQNIDTKFSIISPSTINNQMGLQVPGQKVDTLIEQSSLSKTICDRILNLNNYFEPEVIIRRNEIQRHD